jgi:hypothetical protein
MATTIFSSPIFNEIIWPFVLVFVLLFAILDKTKLLGDGKKQINAIVSLVIALIVVSFAKATGIIVNLMPFLAVMVVIVLVFYIMMGFIWNDKEGFSVPKGVKIGGAIIVFLALLIAVLLVTGYWDNFLGLFTEGGTVTSTIIMLVVVGGALAVVLATGKKT